MVSDLIMNKATFVTIVAFAISHETTASRDTVTTIKLSWHTVDRLAHLVVLALCN